MSKKLIAVYGTLRNGMGNHQHYLKDSEFIGEFKSDPVFKMYSLGGYPGIKTGGDTSITMEVYSVNEEAGRRVDNLEGYKEGGNNWFYDKIDIETPFGAAKVYTYVPDVAESRLIPSGDWKEFRTSQHTRSSVSV